MNLENTTVLSIETAIEGGSLSLSVNGNEIGWWTGTENISKAEDVLEQIAELLEKNEINKKYLSLIKVSNGPGSSTGVKIGIAIAKGLGNALGTRVIEVSAFEALLEEALLDVEGRIITVLPIGKNLICWQVFEQAKVIMPKEPQSFQAITVEEFNKQLKSAKYDRIIFHQKAFKTCKSLLDSNTKIKRLSKIASKNLASLIGKRVSINYSVR